MDRNILAIEKNILATLMYYDVLDFPMTTFEIWKHLIRSDYSTAEKNEALHISLQDVTMVLYEKKLSDYLDHDRGFYFLKGRREIVEQRIYRQKISARKIKRLAGIVRWLKYVPFVRMIGVTGALAMNQARKKSDWDLMIVLKSGKIWTGRTLVTIFTHLLGKRRHGKKIADRVCLNYFIADDCLEIMTKDLFSANEYSFMLPLSGWETFSRFQLRNAWISSMKPSYFPSSLPVISITRSKYVYGQVQKAGEAVFSSKWLENFLRKIEKNKIEKNPKTNQEGSLVYAGDDALIFLPDPHGPKIFEKFKHRISGLAA